MSSNFKPEWPENSPAIESAIKAAFADGSWGSYNGHWLDDFQNSLCEYFGVDYSWCCSSGTIGVQIALNAVGVDKGDEVILAAYDFSGNFRAIEALGARPVLVDMEPFSYQIDPVKIEMAVSDKTKAVVVSHLHGGNADLRQITEICQRKKVMLVEDACQCPGATWLGKKLGSIGDVGVLSFGGSKLLTAGRGGTILTKNPTVFQRSRIFCERGNHAFPLSQLQACVLLPQLRQLDELNARRNAAVKQLKEKLIKLDPNGRYVYCNFPKAKELVPAFVKVPMLLSENVDREQFLTEARARGIDIGAGFRGFTKRSSKRCRVAGDLDHCQLAVDKTVVLHHPVLLMEHQVIELLVDKLFESLQASEFSQ